MSKATDALVSVIFDGECDECGAAVERDFAVRPGTINPHSERRVYCGACHAIVLCHPKSGGVDE